MREGSRAIGSRELGVTRKRNGSHDSNTCRMYRSKERECAERHCAARFVTECAVFLLPAFTRLTKGGAWCRSGAFFTSLQTVTAGDELQRGATGPVRDQWSSMSNRSKPGAASSFADNTGAPSTLGHGIARVASSQRSERSAFGS